SSPSLSFTLCLHDALPISVLSRMALPHENLVDGLALPFGGFDGEVRGCLMVRQFAAAIVAVSVDKHAAARVRRPEPASFAAESRSEEHTSELQSRFDLVCR